MSRFTDFGERRKQVPYEDINKTFILALRRTPAKSNLCLGFQRGFIGILFGFLIFRISR